MARRKNTRPIIIYCLVDMRPETISDGWPGGKPFYVGKTVQGVGIRFLGHRADAKRKPGRKVGPALLACGEHVRTYELETVPVDGDWPSREKFWIAHVRIINPDCANVSDGGFGMTGYIATEETRRKQSAAMRGRKLSPEHCEKIRQRKTGKTMSPESRRKLSEAIKGRVLSEETKQKLRVAHLGKKLSAEHCAKISAIHASRIHQPHSEETKRKIGDRHRGRKHSSEFGQRISERQRGKKHSAEHRAKNAESHRGIVFSDERRRNISEALKNIPAEMRAQINANRKPMSGQGRENIRIAKLNQSDATRRKIGDAHRGMKHTEETKQRLREMNLGKKMSSETKAKIAAKMREIRREQRATSL